MKFNLNIRAKLIIGFTILLVLLVAVAALSYRDIGRLENTIVETQGDEVLLATAQSNLWELRYGFPQFLVLTDAENRKKIVDAEPRLYAAVEDNLGRFAKTAQRRSDDELQLLRDLTEAFAKYKAARPKWFDLIAAGKAEEAAEWRAATTTPFGATLVKGFTKLIEVTQASDARKRAEAIEAAKAAERRIAIVAAAAGLIALLAAFLVIRAIIRPLAHLQNTIGKLSAGDYAARARLATGDELGALGNSFDKLLDDRVAALATAQAANEQLNSSVISILQSVNQLSQRDLTARAPVTQDIIGTVSDSINALTDETAKVLHGVSRIASQVATASGKVQTQAALVSKTAEDDRSSLGQMIDSLADATQTMNQVSALAEQSNASAAQATQATDSALETVNATVKGMESIRETIAETEKRIKRLGERSQEISGIVGLINTISERTHVLALNASMQAAVAGEAGRGFAVVAEEVQRLAESSRNATQQIATLVGNIQLETNETINTVNRTIGQVVQGSEQARKAGAQMHRTQEITGQLVAQVKRIGEASAQQKEMSAKLLTSMQRIGASTERTAEQIAAQNTETESLLVSARQLVESVNVFKLPKAA